MTESPDRTFYGDFKRFFLRGLVILLPSILTLWIVVKAYQFVDNAIAEPINRGVRIAMVNVANYWEPLREQFDPTAESVASEKRLQASNGQQIQEDTVIIQRLRRENVRAWWREHYLMDLIGLVLAIIAVYVSGRLLGGYLGRTVYRRLEYLITQVPVFKQVYPYVKQIVDFLFSDDQPIKFNRVVAVEYPRKGIWSVGFLTGDTLRSVATRSGPAATVFIPSSPTPFTGYTITVKVEDMIEIPLSVEEAIRFAVSGGVLVPEHQQPLGEGSVTANLEATGLIPIQGHPESSDDDADENPEAMDQNSADLPSSRDNKAG